MNSEYIFNILLISLATASISFTISSSSFFDFVRDYFLLSYNSYSIKIGELLSCYYCLSHWVSLLLILLFGINISIIEVIVKVFVVVSIATIFSPKNFV